MNSLFFKKKYSYRATIDNVERRHWQADFVVARQVGNVTPQRQLVRGGARAAHGHRRAENGVGAQPTLVVGAVGGNHGAVHCLLLARVFAEQKLAQLAIHILHRFKYTFAVPLRFISI